MLKLPGKSGLRVSKFENKISLKARNVFQKLLIAMKGVKMKLRIIMKKYTVDSAVQFPKKSILRPKVFIGTTRQRGS